MNSIYLKHQKCFIGCVSVNIARYLNVQKSRSSYLTKNSSCLFHSQSLVLFSKMSAGTDKPVVFTNNGGLLGKINTSILGDTFFSFQGIPYAKPPVGSLRFKAPELPEPWTGIRDATIEGDECYHKDHYINEYIGSEDCLFINVYTRNLETNGSLRPVMFWVHGGGFTTGSSKAEIYGPDFLIAQDVVVVTINYRLGVLGFLSLEDPSLDVPGNAGLKDLVLGLKWVQSNIKAFGGDPNNVTIFGESAGGAAVHYLVLSPTSKGLFHRAIIQSGSALNVWARARRCAKDIIDALGADAKTEADMLNILQSLTVEELNDAAKTLKDLFLVNKQRPYAPVVEVPNKTAFLTEEPIDILKSGRYNHVPILIGYTNREGILAEAYRDIPKPLTDFETAIPHFMEITPGSDISKLVARKIKEFYYGSETPSTDNIDTFYLLESDNFFIREIMKAAKYHAETGSEPVFLYRMSVETNLNMFKMFLNVTTPGVSHADDLGYIFKTRFSQEFDPDSIEGISVRRFTKLWTTFAKYGDPNPKESDPLIDVQWKPLTRNQENFLDIGEKLILSVNPDKKRRDFWNKIFALAQVVGRRPMSKL